MRRITMWLLSTVSALVLLFTYHTSTSSTALTVQTDAASAANGSGSPSTGSSGDGAAPSGSGATPSPSSSSATPTPSTSGSTSGSSASTKVTGDVVSMRYGDVQVRITVQNGAITAADVTQVPWSNEEDQAINSQAVPVLNSEVVQARSASIDMVSGATFTSQAYLQSLQSAIDKANL